MAAPSFIIRFTSLCILLFSIPLFVNIAKGQETKKAREIRFKGVIKLNDQLLGGVKVELKKNDQVIKTITSSRNGKYEFLIEVNSTDNTDADYVFSFTRARMLPKTARINTFIEHPVASSYLFNLDVDMLEQKKDDIVIDLPSANIRWSEDEGKFIFDQTHAKTIKKIKEQDDASQHDIPLGSVLDDEIKKQIQDSLIKKYQKGVTEEVFQEPSYILTKRTVVKDNRVTVYYKKAWNWGGVFYFKEDQSMIMSISENTYNAETISIK